MNGEIRRTVEKDDESLKEVRDGGKKNKPPHFFFFFKIQVTNYSLTYRRTKA